MSGTKFKVKEYTTETDSNGVTYEFGAEINKDFPIEAPNGASGELVITGAVQQTVLDTQIINSAVTNNILAFMATDPIVAASIDAYQMHLGVTNNHNSSETEAESSILLEVHGRTNSANSTSSIEVSTKDGISLSGDVAVSGTLSSSNLKTTGNLTLTCDSNNNDTTSTIKFCKNTDDAEVGHIDQSGNFVATGDITAVQLNTNRISPSTGDEVLITNDPDNTSNQTVGVRINDAEHTTAYLWLSENPTYSHGARFVYSGNSSDLMGVGSFNRGAVQGVDTVSGTTTVTNVLEFGRDGGETALHSTSSLSITGVTDVDITASDDVVITAADDCTISGSDVMVNAMVGDHTVQNSITLQTDLSTLSISGSGQLEWGLKQPSTEKHSDYYFDMDATNFRMAYNDDPNLAYIDQDANGNDDPKYAFQIKCPDTGSSQPVIAPRDTRQYSIGSTYYFVGAVGQKFEWGYDGNQSGSGNARMTLAINTLNTTTSNLTLTDGTFASFTGAHVYSSAVDIERGSAVELVDSQVSLAATPKSKIVAGIVSGSILVEVVDPERLDSLRNEVALGVYLITVAAVGDTRVGADSGFNVCNEQGGIHPGDLLETSSTPGYLMKQGDDIIRSSTVGKAMESVVFNDQGQATGIYGYLYCG